MVSLLQELQEEYELVLYQEELLWYQKSRERWVHLGDHNTKFYHTQMLVRWKRNKIHGLSINDGSCTTDDEILHNEALDFYKKLFSLVEQVDPGRLHLQFIPKLCSNGIGPCDKGGG